MLTPTLQTKRLRLRPFAEDDAGALFALHSDAFALQYWDSSPWDDPARAARFIAASREMAENDTGVRVAISGADGTFLGWCSLSRWNPTYRSTALGYCLTRSAWGQGYATEAAEALLHWAFDTLDLNRVQAETDTRNAASARVLTKLGFTREGTLREDCVVDGVVSDSWVYGLLRREWRPAEPVATHVRRFDHVGITVADLDMVTAFFVALGLEVEGRTFVEGEFLDTVCGIPDSRTEIVMLRPPDDGTRVELSSFIRPAHEPGSPTAMANVLGLRSVAFEVDDLDAVVDQAAAEGYGLVGGIGEYEGVWRMAYIRGPEGIIVAVAQRLG